MGAQLLRRELLAHRGAALALLDALVVLRRLVLLRGGATGAFSFSASASASATSFSQRTAPGKGAPLLSTFRVVTSDLGPALRYMW